jgi:hypothetical protein
MTLLYEKILSDEEFSKYKGKNFEERWYKTVIDSPADGYYIDSGIKKILFKFRKGVISEKYSNLAIDAFLELSKKKHANRGLAGGILDGQKTARHLTESGQSEAKYIASNISGYFDRPLREHRGILGTIRACRTTAFTLNSKDLWNNGILFIQRCSKLFKKIAPTEWRFQQKEWKSINNNLKIPKTVFTTVTSNYNWRTACHQDAGDFSKGLGNLIVIGKDFKGGYLGFPQFKILIKIKLGDILFMDSHQWHCNTPIKITKEGGYRLSFVMYIREDMKLCKRKKTIENNIYFI